MENVWNLFNTHTNTTPSAAMGSGGGQNGHFSNNNWGEAWDLGNARYDWAHGTGLASCDHALVAHDHQAPLYGSGSQYYYQDPHLACLYLGKRHYFEDSTLTNERHMEEKRGRPVAGVGVSRCQVEGCHVALMDAKEYHRRHKVCEMHSKAPRVVVLGVEQRFCQQCSRFHAISEFDDSKRSCRRRLAGHNERRRKGSHENAIMPNNSSQGRALSLLSSKNSVWLSSSADLSTRGSAALHELIAEHRASNFARQIVLDRDRSINNQYEHSMKLDDTTINNFHDQYYSEPQGWPRYNEGSNGHVTLDLMQAQSSAFGLLSVGGKSKDEEEGCSELVWRSLGGSHEM